MYKLICVLMPGVITGHAPNGIPKPGDCHTLGALEGYAEEQRKHRHFPRKMGQLDCVGMYLKPSSITAIQPGIILHFPGCLAFG